MTYQQAVKLFFLLLLISACQKDQEELIISTPVSNVDPALQTYFDNFIAEGAARGQRIDLSAIVATIEAIHEENVAGQCSYGGGQPNRIIIDQDYWNRASPAFRELVVFHELGHCSLMRGHRDDSVNGICQSIMNSGLSDCRYLYNTQNRAAYLNELFEGP